MMTARKCIALRCAALLLCLAMALCGFAGCDRVHEIVSGVTAPAEFPVTVGEVTISSRPQKAVVLSPGLADVILALNCETQLAAGDYGCTQSSLQALSKLDGNDPQAVIGAGPDLVLASSFSEEMASALSDAGIATIAIAPATDREDFERLYAQVGSVFFGNSGYDKGISIAQDIFTTLDDINRVVPKEKITTACYLYDLNGRALTGDTLGSTIMSYAGVTNVFKSLQGGYYEFDSLKVSNPDVIFCVPGLRSELLNDERFSNFRAVTSDRIFEMEETAMIWQGRTVIATALEISGSAFPELLEESSMEVTDPTSKIESDVSSAMATPEPSAEPVRYETLREGDQSEDVLKMQTRLEELGFLDVEYDGYYGSHTAECVKDFQHMNGLEETGVANHETLERLYSRTAMNKDGKMLSELEEPSSTETSASSPEE